MLRPILSTLFGGLLLLAGCRASPQDIGVQILSAVSPDASCALTISGTPIGAGLYDPIAAAGLPEEEGYLLALMLRNNFQGRADAPVTLDSITNLRNRANDVKVEGFEACWALASTVTGRGPSGLQGEPLNCAALPTQSARLPANGSIDEGGAALGVVTTRILTLAHLRALFGPEHDPASLPPRGRYSVAGTDGKDLFRYGLAPAAPGPVAGRPAAWGSGYPETLRAEVIVQVRAILSASAGDGLHSGWFSFVITVCPGCQVAACGDLVERKCPLPCADGSACASGVCPGGPCQYAPQISGYFNDLNGPTACLPAQGGSPPLCETQKVGCPLTYFNIDS